MHQKKKIWFVLAVVLFFCAGGAWYVLQNTEEPSGKKIKEENMDSVFGTPTEAPMQLPEAAPTENPAEEKLPSMIYVYVCGAVVTPGVYELPEGSRLYEAVELAGGCLPDADEAYHNLAREVFDGERLYILSKEESRELSLKERVEGETVAPGTVTESTGTTKQEIVNLNTATVAQLTTLPGIGEARAESIIEYREKVGGFLAAEEIMNISGIGEAMFEKIKDRITVE